LSAQTARSFDESYGVIAGISNKITELAAPLPGETQKYKDIGNVLQAAIIRGYVDKKGNVDFAGFGNAVTDLSINYGALAMGKGMSVPNATLFLQRALNGSSFAELNQLEFGEKSPEVINAIKNELKKLGHTELKSIRGLAKRAELLSRATRPFVSEEFIERSANTIEGITESFNTKVFDQRVGIFGMFREINDRGTGMKTAIESYTKFLGATIGDKGLFTKLGEFAKTIGIAIDPMQIAHDMFLLFTEGVLILGNGIEAATNSFKEKRNIFHAIGAFISTVTSQIAEDLGLPKINFGAMIPKQFDQLISFLGVGVSQAEILIRKGIDFALPIIQSGFVYVSGFFSDIFNNLSNGNFKLPNIGDLSNIGSAIAPFINDVILQTQNLFSGITIASIFKSGKNAGNFVGDLFTKAGDITSNLIRWVFDTVNGVNWGGIAEMIGQGISTGIIVIREFVLAAIPKVVNSLIGVTNTAIQGLTTMISNVADYMFDVNNFAKINAMVQAGSLLLGDTIGRVLGSVVSYVVGLDWGGIFIGIGKAVFIIGGLATIALNSIIHIFIGMFNGLVDEITRGGKPAFINFGNTFNYGMQGTLESIEKMLLSAFSNMNTAIEYGVKGTLDFYGQAWKDLTSYVMSLITNTVNSIKNFINNIFTGLINQINSINIPGLNLNPTQLVQTTGSSIGEGVSAAKNELWMPVWNSPIIKKITGRYQGNIPNAAGGLMSAVNEEYLNMPLGANIVVANNKEFILSPKKKLSSVYNPSKSNNAPTIGNVTININGVGRNAVNIAEEVAEIVIGVLEGRIEAEYSANLS
jgi:hypothetical protein